MKIAAGLAVVLTITGAIFWLTVGAQPSLDERVKGDEVVDMASEHPAMSAAFKKAQATLDSFLEIAKNPAPSYESLALKVRVTEGRASEYFWVSPFRVESNGLSGILSNEPRLVRKVKAGQTLQFKRADVVDWMYYDSSRNRMHGNFTACALLTQESPEESAKFKMQYGLECDG